MFTVQRGWIDAAKRCRTWILYKPNGEKLAEVTTLQAAVTLAAMLNLLNVLLNLQGRIGK